MTENYTRNNDNGTEIYVQDFDWDVKTRGFLLSVFYYGHISTTIPGGILAVKYGGCRLFGMGIIVTSITTILSPFAARIHLFLFIAARIFEGMSEGLLNPSMELLLAKWIPRDERVSSAAAITTGSIWGHVISVNMSSAIGYYFGWEAIFYCTGAVGVVWFVAWLILVKEHPGLDKKISFSELSYIQKYCGNSIFLRSKLSAIPYMKIFVSLPLWSFYIAFIATMWSHIMSVTHFPAYIKDVLKMSYQYSGYLSSLPVAISVMAAYIVSPVADILTSKKLLSVTAARKIHLCGGLVIMAIFGLLIQRANSPTSVAVCLAVMQTCTTLNMVHFTANTLDLAGRYSSVVAGFLTALLSVCGISVPTIIGYLTQAKTVEAWQTVFYIQSGICLLGALMYSVFGSGELQPWAFERKRVIDGEDVRRKLTSDSFH